MPNQWDPRDTACCSQISVSGAGITNVYLENEYILGCGEILTMGTLGPQGHTTNPRVIATLRVS